MNTRLVLLLLSSLTLLATPACGNGGDAVTKSLFELQPADFASQRDVDLGAASSAGADARGVQKLAVGEWLDAGVSLARGDILLMNSAGTLTGDCALGFPVDVGPNGVFGWFSGAESTLPGKALLAVFARIGEGGAPFLVGESNALIAPESGALQITFNQSMTCTVDGGFVASVYTELVDGVELATEPTLDDTTVVETVDVTVAAGQSWQPAGLSVVKGEKIYIDAAGQVMAPDGGSYDADGMFGFFGGTSYPLPGLPSYRLHARVDSAVVSLGTSGALLAPDAGALELMINAPTSGEVPTGAVEVSVGRGVLPAVGLSSLSPADLPETATASASADGQWVNTGLTALRGKPILFAAGGSLAGITLPGESTSEPNGLHAWRGGICNLVPGEASYGLFARVGDQTFFVGGSNVLLAPDSGALEIAVNGQVACADASPDCNASCDDEATGVYDVMIGTE